MSGLDIAAIIAAVHVHPLHLLALFILLDTAFGVVPVEISILFGLSIGLPPVHLGVLASVFYLAGSLVDYAIGYIGIRGFSLKEAELANGKMFFKKYGIGALVLSRVIPFLPAKPVSIIAGGMRYSVSLFSCYTAAGAFIRFYLEAAIILAFFPGWIERSESLAKIAHYHITSVSSYVYSFLFIIMSVLLYYSLVMRRK